MKKKIKDREILSRNFLSQLLLTMKLTFFFLITSALGLFATESYSQMTRITIDLKSVTVKDALKAIENESEFFFIYNNELINVDRKIDIHVKDQKISDILSNLFDGENVEITVIDRKIVLAPAFMGEQQPTKKITGKVTDQSGTSLPGVTVVVKGTTTGVITDNDGKFSLALSAEAKVLVFSFVGMKTLEFAIEGKTTFNVKLEDETIGIEEVVAIGYGTVKKSDLTGSVASVTSDALSSKAMVSLEQGLQGKASGVRVSQTSSEPGGNISIRIRGGNSINAGNEPLYVIDGFVGAGNLSTINPNDIESIEILKDASATSIYGARGANGVVLIMTKRGKSGQTNFNFSTYYGIQQVSKKIPLMNGKQYAEYVNESATNLGIKIPYPNLGKIADTDWQDAIFRTAPVQSYNLTASGGSESVKYVVSSEYFDQKGIIINSGFNRYSFRTNIDLKLSEKLKLGVFITTSRTKKSNSNVAGGEFSPIRYALSSSPADPIFTEEGEYNFESPVGDGGILYNPVAAVKNAINDNYNTRVLSNMILEYEITDGLSLKSSLGIDLNNSKSNAYEPKTTFVGRRENGQATISHNTYYNILNENLISFSRSLNKHKIDLLGGFTVQKTESEYFGASAKNFTLDLLTYNDLSSGATVLTPNSGADASQLVSFLGRVNYVYNDKYLLTLNGRYDGSSRFGSGNKFAFFPSAAFAWRLSEEEFISTLNVFSNLKFRASHGKSGSQEIGSFMALASMSSVNVPFNGTRNVGYVRNRLANPNLKWETTTQSDLGIDMGFFGNRLKITSDVYYKKTNNLLLAKAIPSTSGFTSSFENVGSLENKGLEIDLSGDILTGKLHWSADFNIATNKNKVLDLGDNEFIYAGTIPAGSKLELPGLIEVGKEIGQILGYKTDGIYQTPEEVAASVEKAYAKPGYLKILDFNEDGKIDSKDRVVLGSATPKFYGGLTNSLSYRGCGLDFFITGSYGNKLINSNYPDNRVVNYWRGSGTSNEWPAPGSVTQNLNYDYKVQDASYLRLKYVTLSYNLNKRMTQALKLNNVKIYLTAQNLLTITRYKGYDPENNTGGDSTTAYGLDNNAFPACKQLFGGINIEF